MSVRSTFRRPGSSTRRHHTAGASFLSLLCIVLAAAGCLAAPFALDAGVELLRCEQCQASPLTLQALRIPQAMSDRQPDMHDLEKRQAFGTDTIYTTRTTTVFVRPTGFTPSTTTTQISTVTVAAGATVMEIDTVGGQVRYVTETITLSDPLAAATLFTTTTRTTVTLQATQTITTATRTVSAGGAVGGDNAAGREQASEATQTGVPFNYVCRPGDANEKYPGGMRLEATENQRNTLYILGIYIFAILVAWNFIGFRTLLYPVKMLVVAYHEFWHILVGVCMGQRLEKVTLDPLEGGKTTFNVPEAPVVSNQPLACYFVAMVGNALIGSLLVFCGFNTLASKIASFFVGLSYVAILWYGANAVVIVLTLAWIGLMIGFWFINHGLYLKYYILFIGVMTALYFIWDTMDDYIFRKVNPCCTRQLEFRTLQEGGPPLRSPAYGGIWAAISILFFVGFILLAVAVFRQTPHGEYCQGQTFLPT